MVHGSHREPILTTQRQRDAPAANRPEPIANLELVYECKKENIPTDQEKQQKQG